jgi:hypothetical protein
MPAWRPVSRRELIATLRRLGFHGPYSTRTPLRYSLATSPPVVADHAELLLRRPRHGPAR